MKYIKVASLDDILYYSSNLDLYSSYVYTAYDLHYTKVHGRDSIKKFVYLLLDKKED